MITNLAEGTQAFTSNTFLVEGERTVLVDAGANFDVVSEIEDRVENLDAVVLTHTHPDHVGNLDGVKAAYGVRAWGFDPDQPGVDRELGDEEWLELGNAEYVALHTPGHKDDHLCLYSPDASVLFSGDLVFQDGSFGRTDLEEGDRETLIESIDRVRERVTENLSELHPGHGPSQFRDAYRHVELAREFAARRR